MCSRRLGLLVSVTSFLFSKKQSKKERIGEFRVRNPKILLCREEEGEKKFYTRHKLVFDDELISLYVSLYIYERTKKKERAFLRRF